MVAQTYEPSANLFKTDVGSMKKLEQVKGDEEGYLLESWGLLALKQH